MRDEVSFKLGGGYLEAFVFDKFLVKEDVSNP